MQHRVVVSAWLATAFLATTSARAQEGPADVARRDLIAQAEAAATAGDHVRALQLGERAAQLRVTPSVQYFLAREHLALGHAVEALGYGGACARAAEADLSLRNRDGVLQACRAIVTETERRVARVMVNAGAPVPGLVVRVQGAELPSTLYDVAYPVAPGNVVVEASAPGRLPFRRELQVAASQTALIDVRLDLAPVVAPPVAVRPPRRVAPPIAPPPHGYSVGPWVVAGVGAASLALGGVFFGVASGFQSDRDKAQQDRDEVAARAFDASYVRWLTPTNVALVAGGVVLAGGVTWLIVDRVTHRSSRGTALRWDVSPTASGLTFGLNGRF